MGDAHEPPAGDAAERDGAGRSGPASRPPALPAADEFGGDLPIIVNGESRRVPAGASAADLIGWLGLEGRPLALEVNEVVVPRADLPRRLIVAGDRFEIVTLVGGG